MSASNYLRSAMRGGRDISREYVPIAQAPGPIDVVIADDAGSIEGVLEDSNGDPTAGWVMASRDGRQPTAIMSAVDGRFKISGLAPGDYKVFGWDDYRQVEWADVEWMRRNAGGGVAVSVAAGQSAQTKVTRVAVPRE